MMLLVAKPGPSLIFRSTMSSLPTLQRTSQSDEIKIAIICALPLEYNAVYYTFDEVWDEERDKLGIAPGDRNFYTMGRVGRHGVVLTLLRGPGKVNAASAAASMRSSFTSLRLALLVGVCGGAPRGRAADILLGDVVISSTVIQYDYGPQYPDRFVTKNKIANSLGRGNDDVRNLVNICETDNGRHGLERRVADFIREIQKRVPSKYQGKYDYPGFTKDKLFEQTYRHKHHAFPSCICRDCTTDSDPVCETAVISLCADVGCDDKYLVPRGHAWSRRDPGTGDDKIGRPAIYAGVVASGDKVMKSAAARHSISEELDAIAFEMEGAGLWDAVPSVVVKGVCDYADSHKHKGWQNFAAASAAAATKAILERYVRADRVVDGVC